MTLHHASWAAALGFLTLPEVQLQEEGVSSAPSQNVAWSEGLLGSRSHTSLTRVCKIPIPEVNPSSRAPTSLSVTKYLKGSVTLCRYTISDAALLSLCPVLVTTQQNPSADSGGTHWDKQSSCSLAASCLPAITHNSSFLLLLAKNMA